MKALLKAWLPVAVTATLLIGLMYGLLQQAIRLSYNWPQINLANEASYQLMHGISVSTLAKKYTLGTPINSTDSLFINFYDEKGSPLAGDGLLNNQIPSPPIGFLENSDASPSYHSQTWAPQSDVRIAAVAQRVVLSDRTLFVVTGRNLDNPEQLTSYLLLISALAWAVTMMISLVCAALSLPRATEHARRAWRGIGKTRV